MNEPQLVMSEQINSNSGNTQRHGMSDALIFAKLVFELPRGALEMCLPGGCALARRACSSG